MRVALLEVPAVCVNLDGKRALDDFTLNHPKYPQQILYANLRRAHDLDIQLDFVDLKVGRTTEVVDYGEVDYCGSRMQLQRVGVPFESQAETLLGADIVGISASFTLERAVVAQTMEFLRSRGAAPLIVVGGHDATADPDYYLRRGADLCVLGEGETALQEIVRAVASYQDPAIPGTASLRGGVLHRGARRPRHQLDELAFPDAELLAAGCFDQSPDGPLPDGVAGPIASLETSRGCPEACSFCDISFIVGRYQTIPFRLLVERVRAFKAAGIRTIQVIDDNLLYRTQPRYEGERGRRAVLDLFQLLFEEGFAWEFFNGFQLGLFERDGAIDHELIRALYRHGRAGDRAIGCFRSYVPIDKVTAEEMSLLGKLKALPITRDVVTAIGECGVPTLALGFVIGSVRETRSTLEETTRLADDFRAAAVRASSGASSVVVLPLCSVPLPGTPDFSAFHDNIMFPADRYPELYNIFMSVLRNNAFTPRELTMERRRMRDYLNRDMSCSASS